MRIELSIMWSQNTQNFSWFLDKYFAHGISSAILSMILRLWD
jgi:hypothetical protein